MKLKKFIYAPANLLKKLLPGKLIKSLEYRSFDLIRQKEPVGKQELRKRTEEFIQKELAILFWGILSLLVLMGGMFAYSYYHPRQINFRRNPFGDGETSLTLTLEKEEEMEEYTLEVEELELKDSVLKKMFEDAFEAAIKQMLGKNKGLDSIERNLNFRESIEGYPFTVYYYVKNSEYIRANGSLGEPVYELNKGETLSTQIDVTLSYNGKKELKTYDVSLLTPKMDDTEGIFDQAINMLLSLEEESRQKESVKVPSEYEGTKIRVSGENSNRYALLSMASVLLVFMIFHNYTKLKEEAVAVRKGTVKDFPDIVHYLTLYMGAGLSFSSAVNRIALDYQSGAYGFSDRYAYEQIVRMDQQLKTGSSQKEACLRWGNQFQEKMYQKLSLMLIQSFSKGAKEAGLMLDQARRDAFRQYIDQAKVLGEEASTKLLFPMIILMGLVMLIIMAPAIIQFQVM